jgi:hypothetical protein
MKTVIQKLKLAILAGVVLASLLPAAAVHAQLNIVQITCDDGQKASYQEGVGDSGAAACARLGTSYGGSKNTTGPDQSQPCSKPTNDGGGDKNCIPIVHDIQLFINFLSAGVGIIIAIMFMLAGGQYLTAGDNPQAVAAAKKKIVNCLVALASFIFMYAVLQFLVPGGIY